jgi:membrane dipeptidase
MNDSLHDRLLTLDSHVDIPWPEAEDPFAETSRCLDIPKMRTGGLDAVCLVAYVPQGKRDAEGFEAATSRALAMLETINQVGHHHGARLAPTVAEIEEAVVANLPAIIPVVENGHAIGEDPANIARFRALGARYITLTHNGHNALADSAVARRDLGDERTLHGGLSDLGRAAIAEMNRLGVVVDVSHVSRASMLQAVAESSLPVVASHSCVRALCDHPRNLDDTQLDALAASGGVIQITAVPFFVKRGGSTGNVFVADFCDHIDYVVQRIGIDHVGIGSDFDGGGELSDWLHAGQNRNVTQELIKRGYQEDAIAKIWGGNFLRVLAASERKPAS